MLLDHNYKSTCKFAEDVIAYLYGEINSTEKMRFEQHLNSCNSCADELSGFSSVRSSVIEWRNEEFSLLETPKIEIPYEINNEVHNLVNTGKLQPSMWTQIRDFFTVSPKWMTTAAGFAVLAICVGLTFVVINSTDTKDLAGAIKSDNSNIRISTTPTVENVSTEKNVAKTVKADDYKIKDSTEIAEPSNRSNVPNNPITPTKISVKPAEVKTNNGKSSKLAVNEGTKSATKPQSKSANKSRRPTLSDEDDDDDSLRLSDLFEEVSLR